ncbi:TCR/Tet family MFS transporter [Flavisolibacter tropicus]|uniref:MFS transporter n=1 Tax=Flavisolibacter tropicus TaxID=1492898 RepID=A0A172U1I9_9BACT|nr:TCR/Tet family MFS transporter [Flavisolibacter tropicus]ANE52984.1 MFS transporter [Flavisolibacter tropicus]
MSSSKKAAIGFIFITLLIDVTGLGLIIPVFPDLIKELIHGDNSDASRWSGWLLAAYAIMQFVCAPILGNLSDKYGRRPVLLLSLLGFGADYLFLSFAPTIGWLFVGRIIAGLFGASFTTASAYIADISTDKDRTQNFGMVGAAFGLGFIIGPVIGGLLGGYGTRVPFMVAAGLSLLNALYGYFVLPESLPKEKRRSFDWKRANPVGSLLHLKKYPSIIGLMFSLFFVYIAAHAVQSNWGFYGIEKFGWSKSMIGISLGVVGFLIAVVQAGLTRVIIPKLGNVKSIYIGLLLYTIGMFLFGIATSTVWMFAFIVPYCLGGIAGPALQAVIAAHVPSNEQGELQGALTSVISITSIIGPLVMAGLFAHFTKKGAAVYFPGAPYMLGALLMLISTIIAYKALKHEKHRIKDIEKELLLEEVESKAAEA